MNRPETRSTPGDGTRGTPQTLATALNTTKRTNPRDLVADAPIDSLVAAIASTAKYDSFALIELDGTIWFRCPEPHRYQRHNAGPAHVVDHWRWTCDVCAIDGTRFGLEAIVLASAKAIEALQAITADRLAVHS